MQYRVYDNKEKKWIKDRVYLSPDGELYKIKGGVFGLTKVPLALDGERYIYHRAIDLLDKNQKQVYEGDYILAQVAEDKTEIGIVAFAHELSAWVVLCTDVEEFYTLGSEVCEHIQIIGNVFEGYGYKKEKKDGKQALSRSEE